MSHFYRIVFINLMFSLLLIFSIKSSAQDFQIGTGTTANTDYTYPTPFPDVIHSYKMQYLYLASELQAAGMKPGNISAISFKVLNLGQYAEDPDLKPNLGVENLIIKIGATTTGSLSSTDWEPLTNVVYGPADHATFVGDNAFTLSTPFFWNGSDNILIELCTDGSISGKTSSNPGVTNTENLPFNGSHTIAALFVGRLCDDPGDYSNEGVQTTRPNIVFTSTPAPECDAATLTAGNAVTNKAGVCTGESFKLSLQGASLATGLTYQWQSSPDNAAWTNIAGATSASLTTSQTATTYYRAVITCSVSGTENSVSVQVITPAPLSGTFTIDKNQPAGPTNFQSFNDAYNFIKCGINGPVIFNVAAGADIYNEQLIINSIPGSSATNLVTFNGNGNTIEYASSAGKERAVIKLNGADYITFNNLTINATGDYGFGVQLLNDADFNVINNCNINTNTTSGSDNYAGIVVSGDPTSATRMLDANCDNNTFKDNTITGGKYGLTLVGSTQLANGSNNILHNTFLDFNDAGIYIAASFNTLVESNTLSRPTRSNYVYEISGIYATSLNTRMRISRNTITNIFGGGSSDAGFYGINFTFASAIGSLENIVSNNQVYGITSGSNIYGLYNSQSQSVFYYHNTIVLGGDGAGTTETTITRAFHNDGGTGVKFNNNNLVVTREGQGEFTALYLGATSPDNSYNYNNYYVADGQGKRQIGKVGDAGFELLNDWTAITGYDINSIVADPMFTDLAAGNLQPLNPALDNAGTNVGIAIDITGAARTVATPDLGAYEFNPPACTAPPTAGDAVLSKTGTCVGLSVSLKLINNSTGAGQKYTLEYSPTLAGTYQALGVPSSNSVFNFTATVSNYYRVKVSCSGNDTYSTPVLLDVSQSLAQGTYTIDKNSPASSTNFTSFSTAYGALECGIAGPVVFNVAPNSGPYDERMILGVIRGTSSVNTITFNGNGNVLKPIGGDTYDQRAVIKFDNADFFIFDNLVIDATGSTDYGYGVQMINNADSNIVRNCRIISSTTSSSEDFAGIVVSAYHDNATAQGDALCDANTFEGNTIIGGYYGMTLVGNPFYSESFNAFIHFNKILKNKFIDFYARGLYLLGIGDTPVEDNEFSRPTRTSVGAFDGIYLTQTINNVTILRNRIFNPFGGNPSSTQAFNGIYLDFAGHENGITIANNLIYRVNGLGSQNGIRNDGGMDVSIYHNTISLDNKAYTGTSTTSGIRIDGAVSGIKFFNNIVTVTRGGIGPKYAFNIVGGDVIPITMNNNNYYIRGASGNNHIGYRGGNRTTLQDWITVLNRDFSSTTLNPVYQDTASGNYQPTILPIDNLGSPLGITTDILGLPRSSTTPDIGAYEFSATTCLGSIDAGTATASPNSNICMGTQVTFNLTGNTNSGSQTTTWQSAPSATGPWTTISDSLYVPEFKTEVLYNRYFRAFVKCFAAADTSSVVEVALNSPLAKGVYTINPDGTGNYVSFNEAVTALNCGIGGSVTFNVAPGTYTEQVYMRKVAGASDTSRVTFQSENGIASSVKLTAAGTTSSNYVLKFDSAQFITFNAITIEATSTANARAVVLSGLSANDSLVNNVITSVTTNNTSTARAAIFADLLTGKNITISGNTIRNGATGIYLGGTSIYAGENLVIENNTITGFYQYGIYSTFWNGLQIRKNDVTVEVAGTGTIYGIYTLNNSGAFRIKGNKVTINKKTSTAYGIYTGSANISQQYPQSIDGNKVIAINANTGTLYGIYVTGSTNLAVTNNVSDIKTTGANSYGLYSATNVNARFYNNTIYSSSSSATNNVAAYFTDNSSIYDQRYTSDIRNNIFTHEGGGKAMYMNEPKLFISDYNLFYTTGSTLIQSGSSFDATDHATLQEWRDANDQDLGSIVFKPAIIEAQDLAPDVNAPEVWAIHGRGTQLTFNDHDINDVLRPVTLTTGVPDLGAYEFTPLSIPVSAVATPEAPAPGEKQYYMMGTDTVTAITWGASVPQELTIKRYTGTVPPALPATSAYMYFYVSAAATGTATPDYKIDQYYMDPWLGFIDNESRVRLGRTESDGSWKVEDLSTVNIIPNVITKTGLNFFDKFTGLTDATIRYPSADTLNRMDTVTKGTRFWVGYGHNSSTDIQSFTVVVGGADKDAKVVVRVNGTGWERTYDVPANTFVESEAIPRTGLSGAVLYNEGLSGRGISISSDVPVNAYARADNEQGLGRTGSTLLYPVASYGYEYYALTYSQPNAFDQNLYAWFYVIADHDNTKVEITPSASTVGGRQANVPFTVNLNKGDVYQVLGAIVTENISNDLSGSKVRSISNDAGVCYPIAMFSGNGRGFIDCEQENFVPFGAYLIQQNLPVNAWGTQYLTAPASKTKEVSVNQTNIYRIVAKDPSTVVKRNGVVLNRQGKSYYTFQSNTADFIEADKPIMVAQFMSGNDYQCEFNGGGPEMTYLTPVKNGLHKVSVARLSKAIETFSQIGEISVKIIIPTTGLASLKIDGNSTFDDTYAHPNRPGYSVVTKIWEVSDAMSTIESDAPFTAVVYGLSGSGNSYAYNAGFRIADLPVPGIVNIYDSTGNNSPFNCVGTPFRYNVLLPVQPTRLVWKFSQASNMVPSADSIQLNPVPVATVQIGELTYYKYTVRKEFVFSATGDYTFPIEYTHPVIDNCTNTVERLLTVKVVGAPVAEFNVTYNGCLTESAQFTSSVNAQNGDLGDKYRWIFGDNTTASTAIVQKQYTTAGSYEVKLLAITKAGCIDSVSHTVVAKPAIGNPDVKTDFIGSNVITFSWTAVTGVVNYQVSIDGGNTWSTPSSGATGLTHDVTGLRGQQTITLRVRAIDPNNCKEGIGEKTATTLTDEVFIPNAFSPNGDNKNETFNVEGFGVRSMSMKIFNQWGQLIFQTTDQAKGWDGTSNGKVQPSGAYIYLCDMILLDGTKMVKKGVVNLVR